MSCLQLFLEQRDHILFTKNSQSAASNAQTESTKRNKEEHHSTFAIERSKIVKCSCKTKSDRSRLALAILGRDLLA